jgi:hypothetical protein
MLGQLAEEPNLEVRRNVAAHGSTPVTTLQELAKDDRMKDALTRNPLVQRALSFLLLDRLQAGIAIESMKFD